MAIDNKYGMVTFVDQDENSIAADEPIFIFRARDALTPRVLSYYAYLCERASSSEEHVESVDRAIEFIKDWQDKNGKQVPGGIRQPD